ncbi:helix-turn-helix domain-containing protein [Limnohabitans sp.]|uniref:helix-turn-helix domain-containing protein n=1 Tax=Limnohabitans sp. TaxID=1907725 RepID=UPI002FDD1A36
MTRDAWPGFQHPCCHPIRIALRSWLFVAFNHIKSHTFVWTKFELTRELIAARTQAGLTQGVVAASMGTTQSVVARIESARGMPSMRTVQRFASAVGVRAMVRMEPLTAV